MSITQWLQGVLRIASLISLLAASSVSAQSLACSVTPQWKVSSVTQGVNDEGLSLAIETTDARGTVRQITVSIASRFDRLCGDARPAGILRCMCRKTSGREQRR